MQLTKADINAARRELFARSFWRFYLYFNPRNAEAWWQHMACLALQEFLMDLLDGLRPKLALEVPPQHGKSEIVVTFVAYLMTYYPDMRNIYASFSDRLGVRANLKIQRILSSERYLEIYGPSLSGIGPKSGTDATRNRTHLELTTGVGGFRNTTVNGAITGEGLDLGVIDDPIKGRKEANSKTTRDSVWEWLTDDFMTRFSEGAGLIFIMTRWHPDDPLGRLQEHHPEMRVLKFPALATEDALLMPDDPRPRGSDLPLMPEHKSKAFLLEKLKAQGSIRFGSLYQQNPQLPGGSMFAIDQFKIVEHVPPLAGPPVRYWDKAATEDGGCNSAGVLMAKTKDGQFIVMDCKAGQWSSLKRERIIRQTAELDGKGVLIRTEQEPGSGGKESAEATVRNLAGFKAKALRATGDKVERAYGYAAQVEAGNVLLLRGEWNRAFIDEHEAAPHGALKDRWDASAGAFNVLTSSKPRAGAL